MAPKDVVNAALKAGLDIIAVSDHNTAQNVKAVMDIAADTSLMVIPGIEITTREEVHILSLFPDLSNALAVQELLYESLAIDEKESFVSDQVIVNADDEVEGFCPYLLIGATKYSIKQIVEIVHGESGLAIAAHIDRQSFGIIGQLGFMPPGIPFDALEVSWRVPFDKVGERYSEFKDYPFITNSDAHFLKDVGKVYNEFAMVEPSFQALKTALLNHRVPCVTGAKV